MKLLPQPLPKECTKAAKIFKSFVDSGNNGLDGVIPRNVLENAKGFAIFTIFKAGFLFSARAGSGIVIAKLNNGSWSAPSAIGTAGLGIGGQAGAEMTDFLVVLNSRSALKSFMAAGSLTLGGNMSIAIGPLGRNGEALGSLNSSGKVAAMYSYSKTRGLFGGLSVEGSVIVERQDANVQAYDSPVTAKLLLGGTVDPPPWAAPLIKTLEACTGLPGNRKWVQEGGGEGGYAFGGMSSPGKPAIPSQLRKKKKGDKLSSFPPPSWGENKDSGSYFTTEVEEAAQATHVGTAQWEETDPAVTSNFETRFETDFVPGARTRRHPHVGLSMSQSQSPSSDLFVSPNSFDYPQSSSFAKPSNAAAHSRSFSSTSAYSSSNSNPKPFAYSPSSNPFSKSSNFDTVPASPTSLPRFNHTPTYIMTKPELVKPLLLHEGVTRAIALYDFQAVESGDLSFSKGEVITVTQKSDKTDDWWTGKVDGREGIFPANFVEVV